MNTNLLHTIYLAGAFLTLFAFAEVLYHFVKVKAEVTRKIVHVCTGLLTMLFPVMLNNHWFVLLLCGSFLLILLVSLPLGLLPSINNVGRVTRGSLLYPVIVYTCFLVQMELGSLVFYYVPILILALCDPVAELVGKNFPWVKYQTFGHSKTISGSLGFCISAILVTTVLLVQIESIDVVKALVIGVMMGIVTAVFEGFSHKGYDNLTVPFSALGVLYLLHKINYLL